MTEAKKPTINEALIAVMRGLGVVGKDHENREQRYTFRSIDDLVNKLQPALIEAGVTVRPVEVRRLELSSYQTRSGTTMWRAIAELGYAFMGPAGDELPFVGLGEASDAGDKATMKAMQQAYKYGLLQALAVPSGEADPDGQTPEAAVAVDPTVWAKQNLYELVKGSGRHEEDPKGEALAAWTQIIEKLGLAEPLQLGDAALLIAEARKLYKTEEAG